MLKATRKDVFFKYLDSDWDSQFISDYVVDFIHYWNIKRSLDIAGKPVTNDGYNLLADWEKEDYKSIISELYDKSS